VSVPGQMRICRRDYAAGAEGIAAGQGITLMLVRYGPALTVIGRHGCAGIVMCWASPTSPSACPGAEPGQATSREGDRLRAGGRSLMRH
jgi:hypothetical protein